MFGKILEIASLLCMAVSIVKVAVAVATTRAPMVTGPRQIPAVALHLATMMVLPAWRWFLLAWLFAILYRLVT